MAGSMLSNQPLTLKTTITTVMGTSDTFEIFETGIVLTRASIVFRNKLQLERLVVNIATDGVCTIVLRGLDQSQTKTEVPANKKERTSGAEGYITVLASDLLDVDNTGDEQTLTGNVKFTGNVNVEGILSTTNANITNATVSGKYKGPVVADVTARDLLYPTPVGGNEVFVQSLNAKQVYNAGTAQWESQAVGTPAPDATEVVKGISQIATNVEALAGTNDTKAMTALKTKSVIDNNLTSLKNTSTTLLGENVVVGDSLFTETAPTYAESTTVQNIGDVSANTRVAIIQVGSGVASNTLKLSLRKFVAPSADLSIRIETVSGGLPTGTLVHANATGLVTAASITTSLADTTITLAGSITITRGQQVAIVLSQVGDIVNVTNYYGLGYIAMNTSTRGSYLYNGSVRNPLAAADGIDVAQNLGFVNNSNIGTTAKMGPKITMNQNSYLTSVTKFASLTDTTAYLTDSSLVTIATATFVGNVATFSPAQLLTSGTTYYLLTDLGGASRTTYLKTTPGFPNAYTRFNVIASRYTTADSAIYLIGLTDITTQGQTFINGAINNNNFFYTSSLLLQNQLLSKTNAQYSYKLPNDYLRISNEVKSIGQTVSYTFYGLYKLIAGLFNTTYYISNTPGGISTSQGTNPYVVGNGINTTTLKIDGKNINKSITVTASPFSYVNTTGGPIQVKITGGTVNPIVINGVTTAIATGHINTLPAGATMTVTYTVLPTITYSDL